MELQILVRRFGASASALLVGGGTLAIDLGMVTVMELMVKLPWSLEEASEDAVVAGLDGLEGGLEK